MPSLLDHIDRFTYLVKETQNAAERTAETRDSPFSGAILDMGLGDLARDVDASELGLFTVAEPTAARVYSDEEEAVGQSLPELARIEFHGATPLRRPSVGLPHLRAEKEPEVYAEAALKYLQQYRAIRPMKRAQEELETIINHLSVIRRDFEEIDEEVQQRPNSDPHISEGDEKLRIQDLQSRIKQLKTRKEALLQKSGSHLNSAPKPSSSATELAKTRLGPRIRLQQARKSLGVVINTQPGLDHEEEAFWGDSRSSKQPKHNRESLAIPAGDDSLLLESKVNLEDFSLLADETPLPTTSKRKSIHDESSRTKLTSAPLISSSSSESQLQGTTSSRTRQPDSKEELEPGPEADEETVILQKPPLNLTPPRSPLPIPIDRKVESIDHQNSRAGVQEKLPLEPTTPRQQTGIVPVTPGTLSRAKVRVTDETERIVAKIWSTLGDVIMPGHPFNTALAATERRPPRAKETMKILHHLSTQNPPPSSPSGFSSSTFTSSNDSGLPTAQQILTAHLLLAILSTPTYTMPLGQAKEIIAARGIGGPTMPAIGGGSVATRALYSCIAKKLFIIDRSAGKQIIHFNI